jgi:enamine deaminase RidA (YjgF/YER057c/UK114 family)
VSVLVVQPEGWAAPKGYANGVIAEGRMLFIAGQVGWDPQARMVEGNLVAQFDQALSNVLEVIRTAGGTPESLVRLTLYVVDRKDYAAKAIEIGRAYRARVGKHFPAMSLVEVRALLEDTALVELEATACLPKTGVIPLTQPQGKGQ